MNADAAEAGIKIPISSLAIPLRNTQGTKENDTHRQWAKGHGSRLFQRAWPPERPELSSKADTDWAGWIFLSTGGRVTLQVVGGCVEAKSIFEGIFTHLSTSDCGDDGRNTEHQLKAFLMRLR